MNGSLVNQDKRFSNFWLIAGLLCILLTVSMSRDIFRPFYGLHSWGESHPYWNARVHLNYGLGYTKGMMTKAVGNPPTEHPLRYLNHPQLQALIHTVFMAVLGTDEWTLRSVNIAMTVISLLIFLKILRDLLDDKTALLTGLLFCLLPLIGYFGTNYYMYPFALAAIWFYLVITGNLKNAPQPGRFHWTGLALSLFFAIQIAWECFFFALAIGIHFVFRSLKNYIRKKQLPDFKLLAVLTIAPLSSLLINILVMTAGNGWDWSHFGKTFLWRSTTGEMQQHDWHAWFARLWEFAVINFTLPILIIAITYLTIGQLLAFIENKMNADNGQRPRQFPQFWLFLMIPVFQLFILKGCLWQHQTWERPLTFIVTIAAAQGIMLSGDLAKKIHKRLADIVVLVLIGIILIASVKGTNHYYNIRWQSPNKIKMFQQLNSMIRPDKRLLSFEDFIVNQGGEAKIPFIRPEIAWYLDRQITQATSLEEVEKYAETGLYPYYLIPNVPQLQPFIQQLQQRYKLENYIVGDPGELNDGKFYRAAMMNYLIFNLNSSK
ncbi:MAG: glycosyltransferase family 39 protein [Phycisphaerae bacterium]|jgi:4-amino-4-deoxy-L-arabinose transferase-like glycosyltransferase